MTLQPVLALGWNPAIGIPMFIVGLVVLVLIWLFGQPKKEQQGKRRMPSSTGQGTGNPGGERREPTLGEGGDADADELSFSATDEARFDEKAVSPKQGELDVGLREELERLGATLSGERGTGTTRSKLAGQAAAIVDALRAPSSSAGAAQAPPVDVAATPVPAPAAAPTPAPSQNRLPPRSDLGRRPVQMPVERIVTLFVVAREGSSFHGSDLIVAAEKAGLEFGDMGIYHRLVDGKRELGPIFSVANMLKPGSFDLARLDALRTPGLSFFMTLPAPLPALDAWDTMLPTAQRLAELLDGQVLDEERNALGRQRIAHIRDELRGWDRDHEGQEIHLRR
ncbi:cell division protein ZipA [Rhodanobacter sp. DHB23]|uniref:cell division protein ZipA n=1 Tax=Rhodanobacter sp. DHB23 TaxID=2775923 RepID=UPI001786803E|nr:cell division protein ZipA [Rhodanobacter sp. DHB23]MBD8873603.1 cell division protein ZipA [Rhodanobacter sp. DHB23]